MKTHPTFSRPYRQSRIEKQCLVCGNKFITHTYRADTAKFCSKECWGNRAKVKTCANCHKEFTSADSYGEKYCSRACQYQHKRGENSPAWKDGRSLIRERARCSAKLAEWRKAVYLRDGHKCTICGSTGYIHAHHVIPFSENESLAFDVSNGLTVCEKCHGEIHGKDFSSRRKKTCPTCGKETTGRGKDGRCKSCAITLWHSLRTTT